MMYEEEQKDVERRGQEDIGEEKGGREEGEYDKDECVEGEENMIKIISILSSP